MNLILASASPRRAQILRDAGIPFEVLSSEIDESRLPDESVARMVCRLARTKARVVAARLRSSATSGIAEEPMLVMGADTAVEVDGQALGKPATPDAARAMLQRLSGRTHRVLTGFCIIRLSPGEKQCEEQCVVETTEVCFDPLDRQEIDAYIATGEPFDKAGGYGVQGMARRFIRRIDGCYFNVMGLPVAHVYHMLKAHGMAL